MSERRRRWTALVAVLFAAAGFVAGAGGAAWRARELRAEPWRKLKVEHEGSGGAATRTRVVFDNPKLPLQAIEVLRSPKGAPEIAHIALQDGTELTAHYGQDKRPDKLAGPDGARAELRYKGAKAYVDFYTPEGKKVGGKAKAVPVELRSALRLARAPEGAAAARDRRWAELLLGLLVGEARAQDKGGETITVKGDVEVLLDLRVAGGQDAKPGAASLEAGCPPLTCLPVQPEAPLPGRTAVRIGVTGGIERSQLPKPAGEQALEPYRQEATEERTAAAKVLPDVAAVVAAVGMTSLACKSAKLTWPICVQGLGNKAEEAGAAIHSVTSHEVDAGRRIIDERAAVLFEQAQARAALDRAVEVELCASRQGYARACAKVSGRPFGREPAAAVSRSLELRPGFGSSLEGSFTMIQSDGSDCKFSPSPRTSGTLRLSYDDQQQLLTGSLRSNERGTRANLRCSLGTANMIWSQLYTAAVSQSFTPAQIRSASQLALSMNGTMTGNGSYSFSNCRSSGGASAGCPAGKSGGYTYQITLLGTLDLAARTGSGSIVVKDAPLHTVGSWRIPAEQQP